MTSQVIRDTQSRSRTEFTETPPFLKNSPLTGGNFGQNLSACGLAPSSSSDVRHWIKPKVTSQKGHNSKPRGTFLRYFCRILVNVTPLKEVSPSNVPTWERCILRWKVIRILRPGFFLLIQTYTKILPIRHFCDSFKHFNLSPLLRCFCPQETVRPGSNYPRCKGLHLNRSWR